MPSLSTCVPSSWGNQVESRGAHRLSLPPSPRSPCQSFPPSLPLSLSPSLPTLSLHQVGVAPACLTLFFKRKLECPDSGARAIEDLKVTRVGESVCSALASAIGAPVETLVPVYLHSNRTGSSEVVETFVVGVMVLCSNHLLQVRGSGLG